MANGFPAKNGGEKLSRAYLAIPIIFVIVYVTYLVGNAIWQHFQINREMERLETEITDLEDRKTRLTESIKYYQSETFKEQEARAKLGYQKKGETVIALPPDETKTQKEEGEADIWTSEVKAFAQPNYIRWWNFFFKGE